MRRLRAFAALCVVGFGLAACAGDDKVTGPPNAPPVAGPQVAPTPGECIDYTALYNQVAGLFVNSSPDQNSALGKLNNLKHQVDIQNFAAAKAQALNLVDFILKKYKQGSIVASAADLITAVNNIFCFAGLSLTLSNPGNSWIVYPSDAPQTLITEDGWAGSALPGNVVDEPTLVAITRLEDIFGPGGGPLPGTVLDQYPLFYHFDKQSENNHDFLSPVIVGICAATGIPSDVLARLRLGHGTGVTSSEITPAADAGFLNCANAPAYVASNDLPAWLRGLGEWLLPQKAYAFRAGGGVGGSAEEFSPFAPVDAELSATGGVGGSAGEFFRGAAVLASTATCSPDAIQAPAGGAVDPACRPKVTLTTELGTALKDVPVEFVVTGGGGTIAPVGVGGTCGTFGSSATPETNAEGKAAICWTLGAPGANSVLATPQVGGDALDETYFVPPSILFNATANPPDHLVFAQQPAASSNVTAHDNIPVTVNVVDLNGSVVPAATGQVTLTLNQNTFSSGLNTASVNAVQGVATFTSLAIDKAATGYQMTASYSLLPNLASNSFNVVAAPAYSILTNLPAIAGYVPPAAQYTYPGLLTAGQAASPAPKVLVRDAYLNPVPSELVTFTPTNSTVDPLSGNTGTGVTAGQLSVTSWVLGTGQSTLLATIADHFPFDGITPDPAAFIANTPIGASTFMCELGTKDGDFLTFDTNRNKADLGPIKVKEPTNKNTVDIFFYMSVTGQSSSFTTYPVELRVYRGTNTSPGTTQVGSAIGGGTQVALPGDNGKPALQHIRLTTPVLGTGGSNYLWFYLSVVNPPAQRTFQLWYTPKLDKTTAADCPNAAVYNAALSSSKLGPAVLLKN
jgi:hypothetical protein